MRFFRVVYDCCNFQEDEYMHPSILPVSVSCPAFFNYLVSSLIILYARKTLLDSAYNLFFRPFVFMVENYAFRLRPLEAAGFAESARVILLLGAF